MPDVTPEVEPTVPDGTQPTSNSDVLAAVQELTKTVADLVASIDEQSRQIELSRKAGRFVLVFALTALAGSAMLIA